MERRVCFFSWLHYWIETEKSNVKFLGGVYHDEQKWAQKKPFSIPIGSIHVWYTDFAFTRKIKKSCRLIFQSHGPYGYGKGRDKCGSTSLEVERLRRLEMNKWAARARIAIFISICWGWCALPQNWLVFAFLQCIEINAIKRSIIRNNSKSKVDGKDWEP